MTADERDRVEMLRKALLGDAPGVSEEWSRRSVLRAATRVAALGGVGSWVAACSSSSSGPVSPIDASAPSTPTLAPTPTTGVAAPATSTGLQIPSTTTAAPVIGYPRLNRPVELPDNGLSPVAAGGAPESGPLRILIYPDYINPDLIPAFEAAAGTTVQIETFDEVEAAEATLRTPGHGFDLVIGLPTLSITGLVLDGAVQPLNKELIPNSGNVFGAFQSPYYDVGAKYSMPYSVYTTGISYRRDQVSEELFNRDDAWPLLWDSAYAGQVHLLPDVRDGLSLGLLVNGVFDLNTSDGNEVERAASVLRKLVSLVSAQFDIYSYQNIPTGTSLLQQSWSGDMLQARNNLPDGVSAEVLGYWHPTRAPVSNDMFLVTGESKNPVLAHRFIDFMLDPSNASENFAYVGYQPGVANPSAFDLISSGAVPEHLLGTLVYDADVAIGYRIDPIDPVAEALWGAAWGTVTG